MRFNRLVGAILIGGILSGPVHAADPNRFLDHPQRNAAGAYFGTSLSLTRKSAGELAPAFRLGVGLRNHQQGGVAGVEPPRNSLIEFQPGRRGSSALYIGGRKLAVAEDGRGSDATTILLAVAAAAAAALVISQVADNNDDDEERCMIEPELCN